MTDSGGYQYPSDTVDTNMSNTLPCPDAVSCMGGFSKPESVNGKNGFAAPPSPITCWGEDECHVAVYHAQGRRNMFSVGQLGGDDLLRDADWERGNSPGPSGLPRRPPSMVDLGRSLP